MKAPTTLLILFIALLLLLNFKSASVQLVNLKYFPGGMQNTIQYSPIREAVQIIIKDSLETESSNDSLLPANYSRIKGYLIPFQDGYYKFYLRTRSASFDLSTDSLEQQKMMVYINYRAAWISGSIYFVQVV
jgi:hypothetical protein